MKTAQITVSDLRANQMIMIGGVVCVITNIVGRWVKLDNGMNISRAAAVIGRQQYVEDEGIVFTEEELKEVAAEVLKSSGPAIYPATRMAQMAELEAGIDRAPTNEEGPFKTESELNQSRPVSTKSIVKSEYRNHYTKTKVGGGHVVLDTGDAVAVALRGVDVSTLVYIAIQINPAIDGRWNNLNPGQRSMNARNVIRSAIKKGITTIDVVVAHIEA